MWYARTVIRTTTGRLLHCVVGFAEESSEYSGSIATLSLRYLPGRIQEIINFLEILKSTTIWTWSCVFWRI